MIPNLSGKRTHDKFEVIQIFSLINTGKKFLILLII